MSEKNKILKRSQKNKKIFSIQTSEIYERKSKKIFLDSSPQRQPAEKGEGVYESKIQADNTRRVNIPFFLSVCAHKSTFAAKVV